MPKIGSGYKWYNQYLQDFQDHNDAGTNLRNLTAN